MLRLFASEPSIERVVLYGSRAKGTFERGSDVDLALVGREVTFGTVSHVHFMLEEESPTLLWFDVLHYDTLNNPKLRDNIDRYGRVIYEREA
ncbi:nucleotidyltransferase domain-containing protein [Larkinella soli]|uniref:nucleotidyltransferase domain-containing protein n=1 Tax=Larkinella soli TaxID=1770527 RepID=UPI000FFC6FE8|nr:nucleotidyltransferase domain-containing protein [Larkinella soli]